MNCQIEYASNDSDVGILRQACRGKVRRLRDFVLRPLLRRPHNDFCIGKPVQNDFQATSPFRPAPQKAC